MLLAGYRLLNAPVMGLQTGGELARTARAVIDPRTLTIVAYELSGPLLPTKPALLRIADVREFSDIGLIVDSSDEFVSPDDIIKLGEIYSLKFDPLGMTVVSNEKHRKLGKVIGYTVEATGFTIQQISVKRPLIHSLTDTELLVHRSQITEINDKEIVVHHESTVREPMVEAVRSVYHNPFRSENSQPAERH